MLLPKPPEEGICSFSVMIDAENFGSNASLQAESIVPGTLPDENETSWTSMVQQVASMFESLPEDEDYVSSNSLIHQAVYNLESFSHIATDIRIFIRRFTSQGSLITVEVQRNQDLPPVINPSTLSVTLTSYESCDEAGKCYRKRQCEL